MSQSNKELTITINKIIKELEERKKEFEFLFNMFAREEYVFDELIQQYFLIWKWRHEHGKAMVVLSEEEKAFLVSELGLKRKFEYYEERIDYAIIRHGELITLNKISSFIQQIDKLVIELQDCLKKHIRGEEESLPKIKDILRKKVGPLLFGVAMIGADIYLCSLPTVIAGAYIVYNATVLTKV